MTTATTTATNIQIGSVCSNNRWLPTTKTRKTIFCAFFVSSYKQLRYILAIKPMKPWCGVYPCPMIPSYFSADWFAPFHLLLFRRRRRHYHWICNIHNNRRMTRLFGLQPLICYGYCQSVALLSCP